MSETDVSELITTVSTMNIPQVESGHENNANNTFDDCEEAVTTDSEEYLAESLRYRNFQYSTKSNDSTITLTSQYVMEEENDNYMACNELYFNHLEIPIVGYEVMEERARFTVYKLKIENKLTGDCWFVFRRYTDFARLCSKLKLNYPQVCQHLPKKKWLGNNFSPAFLDERLNGLQTLVNAILKEPTLVNLKEVQDFFCLNEPPSYLEVDQESRAVFDSLEESLYKVRQQLEEKESKIQELQHELRSRNVDNSNMRQFIESCINNCLKCAKEFDNISNLKH